MAGFQRAATPLLIHSQPKSGTTSVEEALAAARVIVPKVHFLGERHEIVFQRYSNTGSALPLHYHLETQLRQCLPTLSRPLRVVTMVRDPIARVVSANFQVPQISGIDGLDGSALVARIARNLEEKCAELRLDAWFEDEIVGVHGADLRAAGFDRDVGVGLYEITGGHLLVLRTDRLNDAIGRLSEFTGVPLALRRSNSRAHGKSADLYDRVKSHLRLPQDLIDLYYDTPWMRLFFSSAEIDSLRDKWTA
ncbi:putative capsular polysaccharide synthesis family protein [Roseobacter sp. YSTF-M11]|uniref:Capsular polysaccharide synthesis family protein n=1 Tax=Roseobacter insulae TaxID=2859783 RepID=A0A9X1FWL5_9RHOB|nr:putative capsular polysaccharide synthesis family protein [Roseobacter insulae]MBW4708982.1 putative capsular polysaccharide synthesis family protein [Roseobacter insulae]